MADPKHETCPACGKPEGWLCSIGCDLLTDEQPNPRYIYSHYKCAACGFCFEVPEAMSEEEPFEDGTEWLTAEEFEEACADSMCNHPNQFNRALAEVFLLWIKSTEK